MNYLVLHVRPYSFRDDAGRLVDGATITYLDLDNEQEEGEKGFAPLAISCAVNQTQDFTQVPGYYNMDFRQARGAKGRPRLVFHSATLTRPADFGRRTDAPKVVQAP